jgi:hypothetical protein
MNMARGIDPPADVVRAIYAMALYILGNCTLFDEQERLKSPAIFIGDRKRRDVNSHPLNLPSSIHNGKYGAVGKIIIMPRHVGEVRAPSHSQANIAIHASGGDHLGDFMLGKKFVHRGPLLREEIVV